MSGTLILLFPPLFFPILTIMGYILLVKLTDLLVLNFKKMYFTVLQGVFKHTLNI